MTKLLKLALTDPELPNTVRPRSMICDNPMVVESRGLCSRIVTDVTTSDLRSCTLMRVRPLVLIGAQTGKLVVPSRLTSTQTAEGHAEKHRETEFMLHPLTLHPRYFLSLPTKEHIGFFN